jgi:4-hydroxy-tetrahydrodipicolinate synthase
MQRFRGTLTALVTPFRGGAIDYAALEAHVERQIAGGVDGLVPCGTTGESPTLTVEAQRGVVECGGRTANGRVPVLAGGGANCTAHAVELARAMRDCRVDGLLVVAPYYNKPSQQGLLAHFGQIATAVELPIVVYNIPGRCGVEIAPETIRRLRASHPTIVAVKHATGGMADAAELLDSCDIDVLSGDDPLTLPLMSLGAVGVISAASNLAPRAVKRLTQAALAGDFAAGRAAHRALWSLSRALLSLDTNPVPVKTAMAVKGWCAEEFRAPLCPMAASRRAQLISLVHACELD